MKRPCNNCPFVRSSSFAISGLRRAPELRDQFREGAHFTCHKTTKETVTAACNCVSVRWEEGYVDAEGEREETGRRIRSTRQAQKITTKRLADLAGMSAGYLSEVERGLSAISGEKLARIATALKVGVDYLLGGSPGEKRGGEVRIPAALSDAAENLGLSHRVTLRLLQGRRSLVAKRSWSATDWAEFYNKVKDYLPES